MCFAYLLYGVHGTHVSPFFADGQAGSERRQMASLFASTDLLYSTTRVYFVGCVVRGGLLCCSLMVHIKKRRRMGERAAADVDEHGFCGWGSV